MLKISVIIPSYKRVEQTIKTINLILASKGIKEIFDLEIIVSDSSPTNKLEEAVRNNFNQKVIYVRPDKPGIATNKNKGAKIASSPILIFCDSDMEVEENTILNTINAMKKFGTAALLGGQVIWRHGEKDGMNDRPRKEDLLLKIGETTYIEALYSRYVATYKQVFFDIGGYDEEVFNMRGEGSDLSIRYWRSCYPLVYDSSIIVHHVHDAPDSSALRVEHPEFGIAKDLLLLAYKYDILDDEYKNFANTVAANFSIFGNDGYYRIIQGIAKYMDLITELKPKIDEQKKKMKPLSDFKFLEIFSQKDLFIQCVKEAQQKLQFTRKYFQL